MNWRYRPWPYSDGGSLDKGGGGGDSQDKVDRLTVTDAREKKILELSFG